MPVSVYNTSMRKENKTELVSHSSFDRIAALKVMPEFDFDTVIERYLYIVTILSFRLISILD